MIELTTQQLRTSDGLSSEITMIRTLQGWKQSVEQADWLPDEWSDEFRAFIMPVLEQVSLPPQQPQQPTIVQK